MGALVLALMTHLPAVMASRLLPLEEAMPGLLDLDQPWMSGVPRPRLQQWEEEAKTAGRCWLALRL